MTIENQIKRLERKIKRITGIMETLVKSMSHYAKNAEILLSRKGSQDFHGAFMSIAEVERLAVSYKKHQHDIDVLHKKISELRSYLEAA
jgi:predicted RNase H-like nuclease (RuvC/YqgF family)